MLGKKNDFSILSCIQNHILNWFNLILTSGNRQPQKERRNTVVSDTARRWGSGNDPCLFQTASYKELLNYSLFLAELFHRQLKLSVFCPGFCDGRLVLLLICHGHDSQDQVHQVERTQKYHQHKENHVRLPRWAQSLSRRGRRDMCNNI